MAELDPHQEAARSRRRAAFGFVKILRILDHEVGQGQDDEPIEESEPIEEGEQAPPADR